MYILASLYMDIPQPISRYAGVNMFCAPSKIQIYYNQYPNVGEKSYCTSNKLPTFLNYLLISVN